MDIKVPLLRSDNWSTWKKDISVALLDRGCWGFIEEKKKPPDELAKPKLFLDYNLRETRAYSTIYASISAEFKMLIAHTTDGAEAFKILNTYFEPKTKARVIALLDKFFSLQIDSNSETIGIFCARVRESVQDLKCIGHALKNLYQGFQLICYMPQEYTSIVQTIYLWDDAQFTFDNIVKELLLEEDRIRQVHCDMDSFIASGIVYGTSAVE